MHYLGIDVSKKSFDCWDARTGAASTYQNTIAGIAAFLAQLREGDALVVDPAGGYEKQLVRAAVQQNKLVFLGNTTATAKLARLVHRGKTDALDARVMALLGEKGLLREHQRVTAEPAKWLAQDLLEEYRLVSNSAALNRNYLVRRLDQLVPGLHPLLASGAAALQFYQRWLCHPAALQRLQHEGTAAVRAALQACHWRLAAKAEAVWAVLVGLCSDSATALLPEAKIPAQDVLLQRSLERLLQDLQLLKTLRAQLHQLLRSVPHAEQLLTIPGVGVLTCASLVAACGSTLASFPSARDLERLLGLDLVPRWSGSWQPGRSQLSKRGKRSTRAVLYLAALAALRQPGPFRAYYLLKVGKGKKLAVVAVLRKLLRVIYAIWKTGTPYDPCKVGTGNRPTRQP